mgnify:CR=1 FL=1
MTLPNFILIGIQKAGTTSIYKYLAQHPQVYMSPVKEPRFLARDWEQYYAEGGERRPDRIDTLEKYTQLFEGVTDETAIGEASANYLFYHQTAARQIQRYVPEAKLVAVLRHPVERAYSDYLMHIRDGIRREKRRPLIEQIRERQAQSHIIQKGLYCERVKYFVDCFGAPQVKVMLYDDLQNSVVKFMQDLYSFLGVDPAFTPNTRTQLQKTQVPRSEALNYLLRQQNPWRRTVAAALKVFLAPNLRHQLRDTLLRLNSVGKEARPLREEERQALLEIYREDTLKLQDFLNRDLSAWLR